MFITIRPSPTADTRTCDFANVSKKTLLESSKQHVDDIGRGLAFFAAMLFKAANEHDHDKFSDIDGFHRDFIGGFKNTTWWDNHKLVNRHHLLTDFDVGVRDDVNLIDVIEYVTDCVMAGKARSGVVNEVVIDNKILMKAFKNTVELLKANVVVVKD